MLLQVLVPSTAVSLGPFSFDPLRQILGGRSLRECLAPFLEGEPVTRSSPQGSRFDVYDLTIPPGMGPDIPVPGNVFSVFNDADLLRVTVPAMLEQSLVDKVGTALVRGPERVGFNSTLWCRVTPDFLVSVPLGSIGAITLRGRKETA